MHVHSMHVSYVWLDMLGLSLGQHQLCGLHLWPPVGTVQGVVYS